MGSGGAERVAANLANAWAARGHSVTLLVTFSGRGECFYPLTKDVKLTFLADLAGRTGRGVLDYCLRFWALRKLVRRLQPDIVVSFLVHVNVAAVLASAGLGGRAIVCERTYPPRVAVGAPWALLRRIVYPRAAKVVMLSSEGLHWLRSHIPRARGAWIPNPLVYPLPSGAHVLAPEQYVRKDRKLLLAVGRLDDGKQFDRLLTAFAALAPRYSDWDLVILGDGPQLGNLEQLSATLDLGRQVTFPGQVGNPGDWYRRADLYVMSSRYEGFPNSLAEAMAHGCAAISYDCDTGPRDIIRHEVDGLLVTPVGDVAALTAALDRLMSDDAARERMAARAVEVRERYSMERILGMWDELFEGLAVPNQLP
jgi:glycosyltransferase involved in cell wall biosynthesis